MGMDELRDSVNGIRMREDMRRAVIENVKARYGQPAGEPKQCGTDLETAGGREAVRNRKAAGDAGMKQGTGKAEQMKRRRPGWQRYLVTAAAAVLVVGMVSVPARALVASIVKERMEEMPQEEKDTYVETLKEQKTEADGFTREYTESEKARYQELAEQYQKGTFPREAVTQVDSEEEASGYEFCLVKPTATFRLPERELTDEELLQIIDFTVKREYAYREDYEKEHAEEIAAREEEQQEAIAGNVTGGGITEQQAIEIATQKLSDIFGVTEDGFERNSYYNEEEEGRDSCYCVNWSNIISHQHYYFYIDATNGQMTWAAYSGEGIREAPVVMQEETAERIPGLQAEATAWMQEYVGEAYQKIYIYYLNYPDGSVSKSVRFYFADGDQSAWAITCTWDGMMYEIEKKGIDGLEDGQERSMWNGEEDIKTEVTFRELAE